MKGFVITIDALVAMTFFFVAALLLYSTTYQLQTYRGVYLKQFTFDTLTVMDSTGQLQEAIDGNSSQMRWLMHATPDNYCMVVTITDETGNVTASIPKEGCGSSEKETQVATRIIPQDGELYTISAESWYRSEYS